MNKYTLKQPFTTRVLNNIRKVFTIPALEQVLVQKMLHDGNWFVSRLIPPDYLYKKGSIREVERDGIRYRLDISHVVDHFIYYGIKDPGFNSILDVVKRAKVILDIGANIGNSSLFFASHNPSAIIHAFEPHPETYLRAGVNIGMNQFTNIKLHNLGLGEEKASLKLYEVNEHNPGMNRILEKDLDLPYKIVPIEKLDTFVKEAGIPKVDLIKIDVEGYEYTVLKGAKELLNRHFPVLFIELDDTNLKENNKSARELLQLLADIGYRHFARADSNERLRLDTNFEGCHYDIIVSR
jgi:FkbM family methyltransferase